MTESLQPTTYSVELQQATFAWQLDTGQLSFFGLPSALFWLNPSLLRMLQPLAHEVGFRLFRLLLAANASLGTEADYHAMVTVLGQTFEEGFLAWGRAVGTAGWGQFTLPYYDRRTQRASVIVYHPWELQMQQGQDAQWGCPFLRGKIIGIFSHAFGTNCWAQEELLVDDAEHPAVVFTIYPSQKTIGMEIVRLRVERAEHEQQQLVQEINRMQQQLEAAQRETVQAQATLIAELSTPLLTISATTVVMPLIGTIDTQRVQRIMEALLEGVAETRASYVIVDITGVSVVDTQVANVLVQASQAVKLLGAQVIITGIRPEVAQTLVNLGVDLGSIITRSSLQNGIAYALKS